jgi:choline dehydrogenase-like flavoprotein
MVGFDYVIVGAAAAGCVLASRLSEHPDNQVLLLGYGGGDTNLVLYVPLGFYFTSRSLASGAASPASRSPPGREGRGEQGQAERDDDRSRGPLYGTERDPGAAVRRAGRRGGSELEQAQRVGVAAAEPVTERGGGDHACSEGGALGSDGPLQRADGSAQVTVDRRQRCNHYYERVEVTMKYERGRHDGERRRVVRVCGLCVAAIRACHTHPAASSTRPALRADRSDRRPGSLASGQPPGRLPPAGPAGRGRRQLHSSAWTGQVRLAVAQLIREFTHTPGILPATLPALPPRQAALQETSMQVTRDVADDRTPATSRELAAAAFAVGRREA